MVNSNGAYSPSPPCAFEPASSQDVTEANQQPDTAQLNNSSMEEQLPARVLELDPGGTLDGWQDLAAQVLREMEDGDGQVQADDARSQSGDDSDAASDGDPSQVPDSNPQQNNFASPARIRENESLRVQAQTRAASMTTPSRASTSGRDRTAVVMKKRCELEQEYQIVEFIGRGAFGEAQKAKRLEDDETVVVKSMDIQNIPVKDRGTTRNEVNVLASLDHPNIVKYLDCFGDDRYIFIVMEYCGGGDLSEYIRQRQGRLLTEDEIMLKFVQMCLALQFIHREKIVHRDLKCSNIFLSESGIVKLGDFGIAKASNTQSLLHSMVGTAQYMAPEILKSKPYDYKSDIFSLGCVLYEMASLRPAFEGNNIPAVIIRVINGSYSPIPNTYSAGFNRLVKKLLQRKPNKRPSIEEVLSSTYVKMHIQRYEEHIDRHVTKRQDSYRRSINCLGLLEGAEGVAGGSPNGPGPDTWGSSSGSERTMRGHSATAGPGRLASDGAELGDVASPSGGYSRSSTGSTMATPRPYQSGGGPRPSRHTPSQRPGSETSPTSPFVTASRRLGRPEGGATGFSPFAAIHITSPSASTDSNLIYPVTSPVHSPQPSSSGAVRRGGQQYQQPSSSRLHRTQSQPAEAPAPVLQQHGKGGTPLGMASAYSERLASGHGQAAYQAMGSQTPSTPRTRTSSSGLQGPPNLAHHSMSSERALSPADIYSPPAHHTRQSSNPGLLQQYSGRSARDRWPSSPGLAANGGSPAAAMAPAALFNNGSSSRPRIDEVAYNLGIHQQRRPSGRSQSGDLISNRTRAELGQQELMAQALAFHEVESTDGNSLRRPTWPPRTSSAGGEYAASMRDEDNPQHYFDELGSGPSMHAEEMMLQLGGSRLQKGPSEASSRLNAMGLAVVSSSGGNSSHSGASSAASTRNFLSLAEQEDAIKKLRQLRESLQIPLKPASAKLVPEVELGGDGAIRWSSMTGSTNGTMHNRIASSPGWAPGPSDPRTRRNSRVVGPGASALFSQEILTYEGPAQEVAAAAAEAAVVHVDNAPDGSGASESSGTDDHEFEDAIMKESESDASSSVGGEEEQLAPTYSAMPIPMMWPLAQTAI